MAAFHGPQAARAAQIVHDRTHETVQGVRDMIAGGYHEYEMGSRRLAQEKDRFQELMSRYHQMTGKNLLNSDKSCAHCGEVF